MSDNKLIAKNPTAFHNYTIENKLEAGIVLSGTEIKSIRSGKANLKDSYALIKIMKFILLAYILVLMNMVIFLIKILYVIESYC